MTGAELRAIRERLGLSQPAMAERIGYSRPQIARVEARADRDVELRMAMAVRALEAGLAA